MSFAVGELSVLKFRPLQKFAAGNKITGQSLTKAKKGVHKGEKKNMVPVTGRRSGCVRIGSYGRCLCSGGGGEWGRTIMRAE